MIYVFGVAVRSARTAAADVFILTFNMSRYVHHHRVSSVSFLLRSCLWNPGSIGYHCILTLSLSLTGCGYMKPYPWPCGFVLNRMTVMTFSAVFPGELNLCFLFCYTFVNFRLLSVNIFKGFLCIIMVLCTCFLASHLSLFYLDTIFVINVPL